MSINIINCPNELPLNISDYQAQNSQISELINYLNFPLSVIGSNIRKGAIFNLGGVLYKASSNTAISGTQSKYVKITPSVDALTCSASFAANLSGVFFNDIYNGYYDIDGNLYIFNEVEAVNSGNFDILNYKKIESFIQKNTAIAGDNVVYMESADNIGDLTTQYNYCHTVFGPIKYVSKFNGTIRVIAIITSARADLYNIYFRILKNSAQIHEYIRNGGSSSGFTVQYDAACKPGDVFTFQMKTGNSADYGGYLNPLVIARG